MDMHKLSHWLVILLLVAVGGILIYTSTLINDEGTKCAAAPLVYGIQQMEESNDGATMWCDCTIFNERGSDNLHIDNEKVTHGYDSLIKP